MGSSSTIRVLERLYQIWKNALKLTADGGVFFAFKVIASRVRKKYFGVSIYREILGPRFEKPVRLRKTGKQNPKVSVIVPNFNHASFLKRRLDSIYCQTYSNFEVLLLDDCSTDNSRDILMEYGRRYAGKTRLFFNSMNSKSVFRQWAKGLAESNGDLIWIAESDDFCDKDFLAALVGSFRDESVMLAYVKTVFVDSHEKQIWTTQEYLSNLDRKRWDHAFVNSSYLEVKSYFSKMNLIANASSAIFRKPKNLKLFDNSNWLNMKVCGDWIFYLNIANGGSIAYSPQSTNYYRIHKKNTSIETNIKDVYYKELQMVAEELACLYNISDKALDDVYQKAKRDWQTNCPERPISELDKIYDRAAPKKAREHYKPRIVLCGYAFVSGGGETFPIRIANELKKRGYPVTYVNFDFVPTNDAIRSMLDSDIPLIHCLNVDNIAAVFELFGIELAHSHHSSVDIAIAKYCFSLDVGHVVSCHGMYDEGLIDNFIKSHMALLAKGVSTWVYTANKNLRTFQRSSLFEEKKFVEIGNAVSADTKFQPVTKSSLGIAESSFVICLVSRAVEEKGWKEAINIVTQARNISGREIELVLIGDGPVYDRLRDRGPSYVHYLGFRENIPGYFAMADIGFLPTYFPGESFPLVILDCLLVGKPMVASNIGEIAKMLTLASGEVAGTVFELKDSRIPEDKVAEIIVEYVTNPAHVEIKRVNAREAFKKFDMDQMISKYEEVYRSSNRKLDDLL